jgi:hypothetical protein
MEELTVEWSSAHKLHRKGTRFLTYFLICFVSFSNVFYVLWGVLRSFHQFFMRGSRAALAPFLLYGKLSQF